MLPDTANIDDLTVDVIEDEQKRTLTFGINNLGNALMGKIDGLDALKQSIYLMLHIEADQYIIYPYTYGVNTLDLLGKPHYYVMAVLPERIRETLMSDSRITDVTDFEFEVMKNKLHVTFIAHTIYGDIENETEVTY